jgi:purine-nucleoside phosphorylase
MSLKLVFVKTLIVFTGTGKSNSIGIAKDGEGITVFEGIKGITVFEGVKGIVDTSL